MGLSQADLMWISRLPESAELSTAEVRTLRRLRGKAEPGDVRLLESLLAHENEILQRDHDRNRMHQLRALTTSQRRQLAEQAADATARRMARHRADKLRRDLMAEARATAKPGAGPGPELRRIERKAEQHAFQQAAELRGEGRSRVNARHREHLEELADLTARANGGKERRVKR